MGKLTVLHTYRQINFLRDKLENTFCDFFERKFIKPHMLGFHNSVQYITV